MDKVIKSHLHWISPRYCSHINLMWLSDAIWWHKSWSTLTKVMVCCLTTPSHYLNQCWLIFSKVSGIHPRAISRETLLKISFEFPRGQLVSLQRIVYMISKVDVITHGWDGTGTRTFPFPLSLVKLDFCQCQIFYLQKVSCKSKILYTY